MPRKKNNKAKQNLGSAKQNKPGPFKDLGVALTGQMGKGLIAGLVPVIVGALSKAISGIVPGPQLKGASPVSLPASAGSVAITGKPRINTRAGGNMNVKHREYVADIAVQNQGFDLQFQFGVNPGNSSLFPWLSTVAQRFEMYSFKSLRFIYEPQTASTSTGTLMLAVDYDATDQPPTDKTQMMSYKRSVRSPLWYSCTHESASADLHRLKTNYVLQGAAPPDTDIKTYDIGNFFVAIQSDGGDLTAGELYVEYDVDLITPQINNITNSASIFAAKANFAVTGTDPDQVTYTPLSSVPNIIGSLPVQVITHGPDDDPPNTQYLWIGIAGYYLLVFRAINVAVYDNSALTEASGTNFLLLASTTITTGTIAAGNQQSISTLFIQIINTLTPQIPLAVENDQPINNTGSLSNFLAIAPFGIDALPDPTYSHLIDSVVNPRARLGRVSFK